MNFISNLKRLRTKEGLSQKGLGEALGMSRSNIASYEQGIAEPTLCNLVKIAKYFEVSLNELLL